MKRLTKAIYGRSFIVASILALVFSVTYAVANDAFQSSSTKTLYACVTKHKALNLTTKSKRCPKGQRKISWNVQGRDGAAGVAGAQGIPGLQGPAGVAGAQGIPGLQGPAGVNGTDGLDGVTGSTGAPGPTGETGQQGDAGPTGPAGIPGGPGPQGPQGVVRVEAIYGAAPASIAGSAYDWVAVGPHATVTTSATQRLVATGAIGLGRSGAQVQDAQVDFCFRPSDFPQQTPMAFSSGSFMTNKIGTQRTTVPIAGVTTPGVGTWLVGPCVINGGSNALTDNDYVNAWVMVVN